MSLATVPETEASEKESGLSRGRIAAEVDVRHVLGRNSCEPAPAR